MQRYDAKIATGSKLHCTQSLINYSLLLDRLVILGNHRDSWNFGAADATSGSAALMEIGRGLGQLLKMGKAKRIILSLEGSGICTSNGIFRLI